MIKLNLEFFWNEEIKPFLENKKVLLILDGLDELHDNSPFLKIVKVLKTERIPTLISSRPHAIKNINASNPQERIVEVAGFLDEDIENYIRFYWGEKNRTQAQIIIDQIKEHSTLWNTVHVPVLLNALCGIISEQKTQNQDIYLLLQDFKSLTNVYQFMEHALLERAYRQEKGIDSLKGQSLAAKKEIVRNPRTGYGIERHILAHLAFRSFMENQLIIPDKMLEDILKDEKNISVEQHGTFRRKLLNLGVLKLVGSSQENVTDQQYEFFTFNFTRILCCLLFHLGHV